MQLLLCCWAHQKFLARHPHHHILFFLPQLYTINLSLPPTRGEGGGAGAILGVLGSSAMVFRFPKAKHKPSGQMCTPTYSIVPLFEKVKVFVCCSVYLQCFLISLRAPRRLQTSTTCFSCLTLTNRRQLCRCFIKYDLLPLPPPCLFPTPPRLPPFDSPIHIPQEAKRDFRLLFWVGGMDATAVERGEGGFCSGYYCRVSSTKDAGNGGDEVGKMIRLYNSPQFFWHEK